MKGIRPEERILHDGSVCMVTTPDGRVCYVSKVCDSLFTVSDINIDAEQWTDIVPENLQQHIQPCLTALLSFDASQADLSASTDLGPLPELGLAKSLQLKPLYDQGELLAVLWCANQLSSSRQSYQKMFHTSAVAQWLLSHRALYEFMKSEGIESPVDLESHIKRCPEFIRLLKAKFFVVEANASCMGLYGADSMQALKKGLIDNAADQDVINICCAVLGISDEATRYVYEARIKGLSGIHKSLWISCEIPSVEDINQGLYINALDISAMKEAEKDLEEREQFLAAILRTVPDILMVYDFKRREPIFQNVDITKMLGYTDKDMQASDGNLLIYITHPDDVVTAESLRHMKAIMDKDEIYETTVRLQHSNGEWHRFYFRSAALDKDKQGRLLNAVIVARDITGVLKTQQILSEQQRRYQLLADNFSDVVITTDTLFRINFVSQSIEDVLGYSVSDFMYSSEAMTFLGLNDYYEKIARTLADAVLRIESESHQEYSELIEVDALKADGSSLSVELQLSVLRDEHNLLEGMLIVCRDVSERRRLETDQRLAAKVFENSMEGIYITDTEGSIIQVNKAFCDITGYAYSNAIGLKPSQLGSGWHETNFDHDIRPLIVRDGSWNGEIMCRRSGGEAFLASMSISEVKDARDNALGMITTFRDITEEKSSEENIRRLAYYDPLTNLPNRSLFFDRLVQAIQRANRNRHYLAILFLDLDGFKYVNDTLGHAYGDRLLTEVGSRLKKCLRSDDTVARMGGDEFTIILSALTTRESAENAASHIAQKLIDTVNEPFNIQNKEASIGTSIGISLYPDDEINHEVLVKLADVAMYHAKKAGKNNFQFYTNDMHQRAEIRRKVEVELNNALNEKQFVLVYHPKLDIKTRKPVSFEALLRWVHPQNGIVYPKAFMRSLDELGMGSIVGEWAIVTACEQLQLLKSGLASDCGISVNVFARHFRDGSLVNVVKKALSATNVKPELLTLEIAEEIVMQDLGFAYAILCDLKDLGVRIAIDDFATGLMSLQSLNRLPIDEIKIDRQFVQRLGLDEEPIRLLKAVVAVANSFGFSVVAEGVESHEQLSQLQDIGCHLAQGYLFSQPVSSAEINRYVIETELA